MSNRAPVAAAGVNAAIVLLLPGLLLLLVENIRSISPSLASNTVHARPVSPIVSAVWASLGATFVTVPLATVAAWRTWVHATKWQMHQRTWRGVGEAGAVGALCVIVMLLPAVLTAAIALRPLWGIVAIAVYAAIGALVGLVVGLMLQVTATAVLKITSLTTGGEGL
ncbi:MAG: hypothetical protein ACM4AI_05780 [Acidobacteriota bacterium]